MMNFLKEAQSVLDFATYFPLLYKATTDNDSITPGYTYEEVNKISFLSHQHRTHLLDFLLSKLSVSSWSGKQKVVRVLLQLCKRGHYEMRILLRQRDGELRKAASQGGPPDPVLANTPQLFFNSAVQELLAYIFDPAIMKSDEEAIENCEVEGHENANQGSMLSGYGSSSALHGKYEGFGNTSIFKSDSIVDQMRGMVEKVILPSDARKYEGLEELLVGDRANYHPLPQPNLITSSIESSSLAAAANFQSHGPADFSSTPSTRVKAHVVGKAGGGWESEEDDTYVFEEIGAKHKIEPLETSSKSYSPEEEFLWKLTEASTTWPIHMEEFVSLCQESAVLNVDDLMSLIAKEVSCLYEQINTNAESILDVCKSADFPLNKASIYKKSINLQSTESCIDHKENTKKCVKKQSDQNIALLILLVLIEYGIYKGKYSVHIIHTHLESVLLKLSRSSIVDSKVKLKAKKMYLVLNKLKSYTLR